MERIVIKNFGPIKDVDLEINDFMIFIGPQASGKSTIAKLIYFYRDLYPEIEHFLLSRAINENLRDASGRFEGKNAQFCIVQYFVRLFPEVQAYKNMKLEFHYSENFLILIELDKEDAVKVALPSTFEVEFEDVLLNAKGIYNSLRKSEVPNSISISIDVARSHINKFIVKYLKGNYRYRDNYFIPAGRGFFSTIANQIFNLKVESLDFFLREFASIITTIQTNFLGEELENTTPLEFRELPSEIINLLIALQVKILKGRYEYDEQNQRAGIKIVNENFIPLDKSSSGQQEAVWIVQYIFSRINAIIKAPSSTVIEEPEAHLYPEAQKSITELIVLLANSGPNQIVITTHSPYILATVNNLLYANKVGRTHEKEVSKRIDKNLWLDYKRVGAYFVGGEENEGRIKRIMDDELEMIKSEYVDSASQIINEEFDFIFALED